MLAHSDTTVNVFNKSIDEKKTRKRTNKLTFKVPQYVLKIHEVSLGTHVFAPLSLYVCLYV